MTKCETNRKRMPPKDFWYPAPAINSAKHIIGHNRAGLCRRPQVMDEDWAQVVRILLSAHAAGNCKETFGISYTPKFEKTNSMRWIPTVMHKFYEELDKQATDFKKRKNVQILNFKELEPVPEASTSGPCHFGHTTTAARQKGKVRWQVNPTPSYWHGRYQGVHKLQPVLPGCGGSHTKRKRSEVAEQSLVSSTR